METKSEPFPKTINIEEWKRYIGRELHPKEYHILHNVRAEKIMNKRLDELNDRAIDHGLYIPALTKLHGNCLFESLIYHGITESVQNIREGLAFVMFQLKDHKNIFPNQEETLHELFQMTNDIEYVYCHRNKKLYKYTYNVMCQDLADDQSWSKLPTQLILMVISLIYRLDLRIINNENNWVNKICVYESPVDIVKVVNIGHITESHYVPLDSIPEDTDDVEIVSYDSARKFFIRWGKMVEKERNRQIEELQNLQNEIDKKQEFAEPNVAGPEQDNSVDYSNIQ